MQELAATRRNEDISTNVKFVEQIVNIINYYTQGLGLYLAGFWHQQFKLQFMTIRSFFKKKKHLTEKPTISQLVKKFLSAYETEWLMAMFTTSSNWSPIQSTSSARISLAPLHLNLSSEMRSMQPDDINN